MKAQFCPSLMCVDFSRLAEEISALEAAGAAMFHVDIMDGHFVPNFALGPQDIKAVARLAGIPYDVHLMVSDPDRYIDSFASLGCSILYVHAEAPRHLHRTLNHIRQRGILAGVAINPGTPLSVLEEVLDAVDVVLVMSVDPGFAGQPFIEASVDKIRRLKAMLNARRSEAKIALDGAVSPEVVRELAAEVDLFILGTAGLFGRHGSYKQAMARLREQVASGLAARHEAQAAAPPRRQSAP